MGSKEIWFFKSDITEDRFEMPNSNISKVETINIPDQEKRELCLRKFPAVVDSAYRYSIDYLGCCYEMTLLVYAHNEHVMIYESSIKSKKGTVADKRKVSKEFLTSKYDSHEIIVREFVSDLMYLARSKSP